MDELRRGAGIVSNGGSNLGDATDALRLCQGNALEVILELDIQDLSNGPSIYALREAIEWNTTLRNVHITLHGLLEDINERDRATFGSIVEAAASLPDLKRLVLASQFIPMPAITSVLQCARGLLKIELRHFKNLSSFERDKRAAFCESLRHHPTLRSFSFHPFINHYVPQEHLFMSLLFGALVEIPTLRKVCIESNSTSLSGGPLVDLCSANLIRLRVDVQGEIAVDAVRAASKNRHIQELLMSCGSTDNYTAVLTDLIEQNQTLTKLTLIYHEGLSSEDHVVQIARALRGNTTLVRVSIQPGDLSISVLETFVETARCNFSLHSLNVFDDENMIKKITLQEIEHTKDKEEKAALMLGKKIEFYTMLNRSGRGILLGNKKLSKAQWTDKLGEVSYILDCLFFFLQVNPTLCCSGQSHSPENPGRPQHKYARKESH